MTERENRPEPGFTFKEVDVPAKDSNPRPSPKWNQPPPPEQPPKGYVLRFNRNSLGDLPLQKWQNSRLSPGLIQAIDRWKDDFAEHTFGQMEAEDRQRWIAEGKRLAAEIRRELGPTSAVGEGCPVGETDK
jgi:hypothetical protein